jgi:hypothetical protein
MFEHIERDVIVACDPANMGEAVVCDLDGRYLATMHASRLMEHGPTSRDEIRASIRMRRQVKRAIKGYVGGLIDSSYARGEQSEIEILRERAGVSAMPRVRAARALPAASGRDLPGGPIGYDDVVRNFYAEED